MIGKPYFVAKLVWYPCSYMRLDGVLINKDTTQVNESIYCLIICVWVCVGVCAGVCADVCV